MMPRLSLLLLVVALAVPSSRARAAPLDVKTGSWETTTTSDVKGVILPESMLQKMTPEQRAQVLSEMKKHQDKGPETETRRSCVTKKDLERPFMDENQKDCKRTTLASTGKKQEFRYDCPGGKGHFKVEVVSRELVKGDMTFGTGHGDMKVKFVSKWLGAECRKEDLDEGEDGDEPAPPGDEN